MDDMMKFLFNMTENLKYLEIVSNCQKEVDKFGKKLDLVNNDKITDKDKMEILKIIAEYFKQGNLILDDLLEKYNINLD